MPSPQPVLAAVRGARAPRLVTRPTTIAQPDSLIDTALVRAELARLRALRPQTRPHAARIIRSTISGPRR